MAQFTLLLADNDLDYLDPCRDFLVSAGFEVRIATSPAQAKEALERGGIDLAILDVRLVNNKDEKDFSGITIARTVAPEVPKILLTKWPTYETAVRSLGSSLDGLPRPADCVDKNSDPEELLTAVRNALEFESRYHASSNNLASKLDQDYREARQQSRLNYRLSLIIAALGAAIIFAGAYLALNDKKYVAILSAMAGVLAEATTVLFFKRTDSANERMDRYHRELLETRELEILLDACEELPGGKMRDQCKERVINTATAMWLGPKQVKAQPPHKRSANQERSHEKETVGRGQ